MNAMKNVHVRRMAVILVVLVLAVLLDELGNFQWMKQNPLLFGMGISLTGMLLSRRLEKYFNKNSGKA